MNPKNTLLRRLRSPRSFSLAGLMVLGIVVAALAMIETPTVAAPPPPLRGPFHFIELPDRMSAAAASTAIQRTPLYTQTFGNDFSGWTITRSTEIYATPATLQWDRVISSQYPGQPFTNTLWSGAFMQYRSTNYTVYSDPTQYTQTMDTWAIYGPLDTQHYSHFQAEFDFYLDAGPGAYFGWAASNNGQTFCGKLGSSTTGSRIQKWQHMTFDLTECSAGAGTPVYLAFFFQSDNNTPAGLGAFVDNLVISGQRLIPVYLPIVRLDPTPTPTPTPTFTGVLNYDFESGTGDWCSRDTGDFTSSTKALGASGNHAYYLKVKDSTYMIMQSPRRDPPDNYRITANFSLLGMNNSLNLANYGSSQFGLIFGVWGAVAFPPSPNDDQHCAWGQGADDGGYYEFIIKVRDDGTGYRTKLERHEKQTLQETITGSDVSLSRTDWNTLRLDRVGSGIVIYINGVQVLTWSNSTQVGHAWWGVFTETRGNNPNGLFESDWDNIQVYNLGS